MAAPQPTARATPGGTALCDGFSTLITLENDTNIEFREVEVQPFGIDGGEKIDTTDMHNSAVMTYCPQSLYEVTDANFTCRYDPAVLPSIISQINVKQEITISHSDGSTWAAWGYLRSFTPANNTKGTTPTAAGVISFCNTDASGAEYGPEYDAATGTGTP